MGEEKHKAAANVLPAWAQRMLQSAAKKPEGFKRVQAIDAACAVIRQRLPERFKREQ